MHEPRVLMNTMITAIVDSGIVSFNHFLHGVEPAPEGVPDLFSPEEREIIRVLTEFWLWSKDMTSWTQKTVYEHRFKFGLGVLVVLPALLALFDWLYRLWRGHLTWTLSSDMLDKLEERLNLYKEVVDLAVEQAKKAQKESKEAQKESKEVREDIRGLRKTVIKAIERGLRRHPNHRTEDFCVQADEHRGHTDTVAAGAGEGDQEW